MTILSGIATTAVTLGFGQNYLITPTGQLNVSGSDAITASDTQRVSVSVAGSMTADGASAISFSAAAAQFSAYNVTVAETGVIQAAEFFGTTILFAGGRQNSLMNAGTVTSNGAASVAVADTGTTTELSVVNNGTISGVNAGVQINGSEASVANSGTIHGAFGGLRIEGDDNSVTNSGTISSGGTGLLSQQNANLMVTNTGTISGSERGAGFFSAVDNVLFNHGMITSGQVGIELFNFGSGLRLVNTGTVSGPQGAYVSQDNQAVLDDIVNSGSFIGDVSLGAGADTYRARGDGHVEGAVNGGRGGDVLIGGRADDDLRGGNGNDTIKGRRGDDEMRGGAGSDTFEFTRRSDDDVIADFRNGDDLLDLTAFDVTFAQVSAALSRIAQKVVRLDLDALGGEGSVLIEGVRFGQVDAGDFVL